MSDKRFKPNSPQKLAQANGQIRFQGNPCKNGHLGIRYTKGARCVDCVAHMRNTALTPRGRSVKNNQLSLQAAAANQTTYIPEKPCKYGHSLRYVGSNNCVECDKFQLEKHKITAKFSRIKKLYGLTKEQYLNLVKTQNSKCKICKKFIEDHFKLHVDHCHFMGNVRALLCNTCNQGIGLFKHNSELLRKAALYCEAL